MSTEPPIRPAEGAAAPVGERRCPDCGATVRHDVPWCLRCYADLTETTLPVPVDPPSLRPAPRSAPAAGPGGPADPVADPVAAAALADRMLLELAAQPDQRPGWLARVPTGAAARTALAAAAVVAFAALLLGVMTVLGLLL